MAEGTSIYVDRADLEVGTYKPVKEIFTYLANGLLPEIGDFEGFDDMLYFHSKSWGSSNLGVYYCFLSNRFSTHALLHTDAAAVGTALLPVGTPGLAPEELARPLPLSFLFFFLTCRSLANCNGVFFPSLFSLF